LRLYVEELKEIPLLIIPRLLLSTNYC